MKFRKTTGSTYDDDKNVAGDENDISELDSQIQFGPDGIDLLQ